MEYTRCLRETDFAYSPSTVSLAWLGLNPAATYTTQFSKLAVSMGAIATYLSEGNDRATDRARETPGTGQHIGCTHSDDTPGQTRNSQRLNPHRRKELPVLYPNGVSWQLAPRMRTNCHACTRLLDALRMRVSCRRYV